MPGCIISQNINYPENRLFMQWPYGPLGQQLPQNPPEESVLRDYQGVILTVYTGEFQILGCGDFERLPDIEDHGSIKEGGAYLVNSGVGAISVLPKKVMGQIPAGTYQNSGTGDYTLCMIYKIPKAQDIGRWIALGHGQLSLDIDDSWQGIQTSGCGEWQLMTEETEKNESPGIPLPGGESVWDYCARVGAKELQGDFYRDSFTKNWKRPHFKLVDDLPDHIAQQVRQLTFHPAADGPIGMSTYSARCGYVDGSDTATLLMCQPANWWGLWDRAIPPTNGAKPWRDHCLFNEIKPGDSSEILFTDEVIERICRDESRALGIHWIGENCFQTYLLAESNGGKETMNPLPLRREFNNNAFRGSYIQGDYFYPVMYWGERSEIDRDGYFSSIWHHIPVGCSGFEIIEIPSGEPNLWAVDFGSFTTKDHCNEENVLETEVAWVIPEGRVKLSEWLLEW